MRNTRDGQRDTWASYALAARKVVAMSQSELARQLGVDRVTVYRWEKGQQRPENAEVVDRFAQVLGVDLDEALAAAGLRPGVTAPSEPARPEPQLDPDLQIIKARLDDPSVSEAEKATIRATLHYLANLADRTATAEKTPARRRRAS